MHSKTLTDHCHRCHRCCCCSFQVQLERIKTLDWATSSNTLACVQLQCTQKIHRPLPPPPPLLLLLLPLLLLVLSLQLERIKTVEGAILNALNEYH
jgi:hypothetical protein